MTARERQFVVVGALLSALILLAAVLPRLRAGAGGESAAAAELEEERLARLRGLAGSLDTLRSVVRRAETVERRLQTRYLQGVTLQVSAAQLSEAVQRIADAAGVEVLRMGVLPPRAAGRASAIPVQVVARTDLPGMLELLEGIQRSPLLLSVESISVSGDPRELPGVAALTVTLSVTGFSVQQPPDVEDP